MKLNTPMVLFDTFQALSDNRKLIIEVFRIGAQSSELPTKLSRRRKDLGELVFGDRY